MKITSPLWCPRFIVIALLGAFAVSGLASATPLKPGQTFPVFKNTKDQHEKAYPMPKELKHVAVAFTMGVGKSANQALAEKGADYLPAANAVFIANIYGMPGIGRFFAMPKMRKYPHRIMLADAEGLLDDFPQKEDKVTVFDLNASGEIVAIRFWDPKDQSDPF